MRLIIALSRTPEDAAALCGAVAGATVDAVTLPEAPSCQVLSLADGKLLVLPAIAANDGTVDATVAATLTRVVASHTVAGVVVVSDAAQGGLGWAETMLLAQVAIPDPATQVALITVGLQDLPEVADTGAPSDVAKAVYTRCVRTQCDTVFGPLVHDIPLLFAERGANSKGIAQGSSGAITAAVQRIITTTSSPITARDERPLTGTATEDTKEEDAPVTTSSWPVTAINTTHHSQLLVFWVDAATGQVRHQRWNGDWSASTPVDTAKALPSISAISVNGAADGARVYYATDKGIHEASPGHGTWHTRDLASELKFVPRNATAISAMTYSSELAPRVYLFNEASHVVELAWVDGSWHLTDFGASLRAPPGAAGSCISAIGYGGNSDPRVYYVSTDKHIIELAWCPGWNCRDLTAELRAPAVATDALLVALGVGHTHDPRVYYVASDRLLHELAWWDGWHHRAVGAECGSARVSLHSSLSAMGVGDSHDPRVYFVGSDAHYHELCWSGGWSTRNLSQDMTLPPTAGHTRTAATGYDTAQFPRVYALSATGHLQEHAWYDSAWHARDLCSN